MHKTASLTPREQDRIMNELLEKFKQDTLEMEDARKLKDILEQKREQAFNLGDIALGLGIVFLLAGLIGYIAER